ncbi:MAG: acyl carrier protein [Burkholderiales bacterium]
MNESTLDVLRTLIVQRFEVSPDAVDDHRPFAEMGLDSLGLVDFIFQVEDLYHVVIDHEQALAVPTLAGLSQLVDRLRLPALAQQA